AARTIEPAIGASTWAFGSHRCRPYKGIFVMKAIVHASQTRLCDQVVVSFWSVSVSSMIFNEPALL
ncbi:hypothetical protein, partial [Bartonella sp. CR127HXZ]|uniref:hypothetical protein n=1 Tax=Bartonella sp. CR127HXZ TaxID=1460985 RepID=UPI0035CF783B